MLNPAFIPPAFSNEPRGPIVSGLPFEDCDPLLRQNGFFPKDELIPAEGFFALYMPFDSDNTRTLELFCRGKRIATVRQRDTVLSVKRSLPVSSWWTLSGARMSEKLDLSYRRERTTRGTKHSYWANLVEEGNLSPTEARLSVCRMPWDSRYTNGMHRIAARFEKIDHNPRAPRYLEAAHDDTLPPAAQRQEWFRKLPQVRL